MKNEINQSKFDIWEWTRTRGLQEEKACEDVYRLAGRLPITPRPDQITLTENLAEELYDTGKKAGPISARQAPLAVFDLSMYSYDGSTNLYKLLQPKHPHRNDMEVYGFDATFVTPALEGDPELFNDFIYCLLSLHDCNDSSGGTTTVILFSFCGEPSNPAFSIVPSNISEGVEWLCDLDGLKQIALMLCFLWRGIQNRLINRPELVRQQHVKVAKKGAPLVKTKAANKIRIVKTYKVLTFMPDSGAGFTTKTPSCKTISCPAWGVLGHWRQYKTGKRVWVSPYTKGVERNNHRIYTPKEYAIPERATQ